MNKQDRLSAYHFYRGTESLGTVVARDMKAAQAHYAKTAGFDSYALIPLHVRPTRTVCFVKGTGGAA